MSRTRLAGAAAGLVAACVALAATLDAQRGATPVLLAITGATLIDGSGRPPAPNHTVLIEGPRIIAVGPAGTVRIPANARIVNATGKFVLPGLIDGRAHWRGWTGELFLNHGITTIVDAGGPSDWILAVRDAERGGSIRGPRILTAAGAFDRRARADDIAAFEVRSGSTSRFDVAGADSARSAVRALLVKGPDFINIGGDLTLDELRAITGEAHAVDVPVLGDFSDVDAALEAGVDGIAHLSGVSQTLMTPAKGKEFRDGKIASPHAWIEQGRTDALVARMIQRGTYLIPLLVADHGAAAPQARRFELANYDLLMRPELRYVPLTSALASLTFWRTLRSSSATLGPSPFGESVPPHILDEFRRGYVNAKEFVGRFARAGGRVVAGTGAGGTASVPGISLHQELELLVDAGLTPMQALVSATRAPAELLKKESRVGTIATGKFADLVILDADPLADIANTRKISAVVKNGQLVDTSYHREYYTDFAEADSIGTTRAAHGVPVVTDVISVTMNQMSQVIHDGSPFDLVVRGYNFDTSSLIELNGRPLATTFTSATELRARVPTERIAAAGTYTVTVSTPWPGGGRSNITPLPVK